MHQQQPFSFVTYVQRPAHARRRSGRALNERLPAPDWRAHLGVLQDEHGLSEHAAAWCAEHGYRTLGQLRKAALGGHLRSHPHRDEQAVAEVERLVFHAIATELYLASFTAPLRKRDLWAEVLQLPYCTLAQREGHIRNCIRNYTGRKKRMDAWQEACKGLTARLDAPARAALANLLTRYDPGDAKDLEVILNGPMDALLWRGGEQGIRQLTSWQRHVRARMVPNAQAPQRPLLQLPEHEVGARLILACSPLSTRARNVLFEWMRYNSHRTDLSTLLQPDFDLYRLRNVGRKTLVELDEWREHMRADAHLRCISTAHPAWEAVLGERWSPLH